MALTHFKVIRVMSRCNFYTACTAASINIVIGNYRDFSINKWQD